MLVSVIFVFILTQWHSSISGATWTFTGLRCSNFYYERSSSAAASIEFNALTGLTLNTVDISNREICPWVYQKQFIRNYITVKSSVKTMTAGIFTGNALLWKQCWHNVLAVKHCNWRINIHSFIMFQMDCWTIRATENKWSCQRFFLFKNMADISVQFTWYEIIW